MIPGPRTRTRTRTKKVASRYVSWLGLDGNWMDPDLTNTTTSHSLPTALPLPLPQPHPEPIPPIPFHPPGPHSITSLDLTWPDLDSTCPVLSCCLSGLALNLTAQLDLLSPSALLHLSPVPASCEHGRYPRQAHLDIARRLPFHEINVTRTHPSFRGSPATRLVPRHQGRQTQLQTKNPSVYAGQQTEPLQSPNRLESTSLTRLDPISTCLGADLI